MISPPPNIYLAGPDVFAKDVLARFEELSRQCLQRGLAPVVPSDGDVKAGELPPLEHARAIYHANIKRLDAAHGVLANLTPFRGTEPDSGTVFEVGYAVARGLPVAVVYAEADTEYAHRVKLECGTSECGQFDAKQGWFIENFGQPLNLMLAVSCQVFTSSEDALDWLAQELECRATGHLAL